MEKSVWAAVPASNGDKYIDGFESIGDVSRSRNKSKEIAPTIFISRTKEDPIGNSQLISQSIRTSKSDAALGVSPIYDSFSSNDRLKNYSRGLIVSTAVDHVIPWNHSESSRGAEFKALRPDYGKMYPKSSQAIIQHAMRNEELFGLPFKKQVKQEHLPEENDVFEYK